MARNKSAKRTVKRQTKNNNAVNVQKAEKDFYQVPAKLAAQFNKDINSHKNQQNKLNKSLAKCLAQVNKAQAKENAAAAKAKTSSSGKKAWNAAKKAHVKVAKVHAGLKNQFESVTKALNELLNNQAKFNALHKYLGQFEKEWAKTLKQIKAEAQAKAAKAKAKKSRTPKLKAVNQTNNNSQVENLSEQVDNVSLDEPTELAS